MIKTRGILPPEEIVYQMHDGQDREAPPHHGQENGPWNALEEDLHEGTGRGRRVKMGCGSWRAGTGTVIGSVVR